MTKLDQFESAFRAADRVVYRYTAPELRRVLVVTDLAPEPARAFTDQAAAFLQVLGEGVQFEPVSGERFRSVGDLLALVEAAQPNLVLTFRHLHSSAWQWPHSLGEHLDVLTQVVQCPVMVAPHPDRGGALAHALTKTTTVMAITDHLTGDHRLVDYAVRFTDRGGRLLLTHVEDQQTFERYMQAISKIPNIDTQTARDELLVRLLKEPRDYIESCEQALAELDRPLTVESLVLLGHRLLEVRQLIEPRTIDLMVMNTHDEGQFAMHGLAYPLAVELRSIPLLML